MKTLSTSLQERILRYDGVSVVSPDNLVDALLRGVTPNQVRLTQHDADTLLFNDSAEEQLIVAGDEPVNLDFAWKLPEQYLNMDLDATVVARAADRLIALNYPEDIHLQACTRIQDELEEIKRRGMVEFLRTIIFIIDTFRQQKVLWGVGRGSSCASYVLFILGLHCVDSILYSIPMEEFFHD